MSLNKRTRGKTQFSTPFFFVDTSSTTGGGLSGVTSASPGLVMEYRRQGQSTWTNVTPQSGKTLGSYLSGGIVADTGLDGAYEVDFPDAAFASAAGVEWVQLRVRGVTNMLATISVIELDAVDYQDAAAFGLSRIDQTIGSRATQTSVDTEVAAIKAKTDLITAFPANFANLGIDPSGSILIVETVAELGASALTANGAGDAIPVYVWDEILNGATHNIPSSAGRRLRQIASSIVYGGTAQGPGTGNNQIQLDTGASATNGAYDPSIIAIEAGTGAGQTRLILQYVGSTRTATVDRDWRINPDNTSEFVILGDAGRESVNEGLAQGGTATSITLNASASSTDDAYNGQLVFIRSGTGQDQVALVEDYVGSTKVATIRTRAANGQWATTPNTTSAYVMIPNLTFTVAEIAAEVGTLQVLTRLDSMIESDGAGQFRFDTIALEMAPAGGGGGGTDWTANERTAIRAILGVPTSGTTPTDPTTGILDTIRDSIGGFSTINVYPVSASTPERVAGTTITYYRNEIRTVSVATDFTLTSLTLVFVIEDAEGTDLLSIPNSSISRSDKTFTVSIGTAVTATVSNYRWSLRDITGGTNSVIARGVLTVQEAG